MEYIHQFIDIVLNLDEHLTAWGAAYGPWIYAILFAIVFCETGFVFTPFLPGDSLLFAAGAMAGTGATNIYLTMSAFWLAATLGDNVNYWVGRYVGPRVFQWEDSRFFKRENLMHAHAFFEKHGAKALIMARFMPIVRTFMPFTAGIASMNYVRFVLTSILGGAIWVGSITLTGYWLGSHEFVKKNLEFFILGIVVVSLIPGVVAFIKMRAGRKSLST